METISYLKYGNGKVYLKLNKKRIGMIHVLDGDQPSIYISHLDINDGFRDRGFGTMLLNSVIERFSEKEAVSLHVSTSNKSAIRFYRRFGFIIACTTTDKKDRHFLMVKQLYNVPGNRQ